VKAALAVQGKEKPKENFFQVTMTTINFLERKMQ
jgi:hypothetical protein